MFQKMIHHPLRRCTKHSIININMCHNDIIIALFYEESSVGSPSRVSLLDEVVREPFLHGPRFLFEPIEGLL